MWTLVEQIWIGAKDLNTFLTGVCAAIKQARGSSDTREDPRRFFWRDFTKCFNISFYILYFFILLL